MILKEPYGMTRKYLFKDGLLDVVRQSVRRRRRCDEGSRRSRLQFGGRRTAVPSGKPFYCFTKKQSMEKDFQKLLGVLEEVERESARPSPSRRHGEDGELLCYVLRGLHGCGVGFKCYVPRPAATAVSSALSSGFPS